VNNVDVLQGDKYLWKLPGENRQAVLDLAVACSLSLPIAQVLVQRGFVSKEKAEEFLFPSLEKDVFNGVLLADAQKAVDRILLAIECGEKILVFGDYDVDGITSSAMVMKCLLDINAKINFFLPNRVTDGYGISAKFVEKAAKNNYKLIITVDNGIAAFEAADKAKELGIDLIITDHHRPHDKIPEAFAVIDPARDDCGYPFKSLAGVGVTFKLLSLLYDKIGLQMSAKVYELLLLGTVADVVPLLGENRFWVRHGLNYVNKIESYSLSVLKKNGNVIKPSLSATDIGYFITPQINALGRLEDPRQGVKFLLGSDKQETDEVGKILFELNQARKQIERAIFQEIVSEIEKKNIDLDKENIILVASKSWPQGVIGIVASRLAASYGKPAILFHLTKDGKAKGSCRSIPEFNIFNALQKSSDILDKFGGHAFAAGLSLSVDNIAKLKARLEKIVSQELTEFDLKQKLVLDAQANLCDLNKKFLDDMELLAPFGNKNSRPSFYIKNVVQVQKPTLLKGEHVKINIFSDGVIKPVVFFGRPELYDKFLEFESQPFDLAANVVENYWNGRVNIELIGLDIAIKK
jgi:single-stranded-DNA-specific exonuclease